MSNRKVKTKLDELSAEYSRLSRDTRALTLLLVSMIFAAAMFLAWYIVNSNVEDIWYTLQTIGVLVSALIISKTASHHICYSELVRKSARDVSIVKRTHQSIAILNDLNQRVGYVKNFFERGNQPLIALSKNVKSIEEHYQFFYRQELYEFLSPSAIQTIGNMSGCIFGLCTLVEGLTHEHDTATSMSASPAIDKSDGILRQLDALLDEIRFLDDEIRNVRGSIDG